MFTSRLSRIVVVGLLIVVAVVTVALVRRPAAPATSPEKSLTVGAFNPSLYFPLPRGKQAPRGSAADLYLQQHSGDSMASPGAESGASAASPILRFPVGKFIRKDTDHYGLYFDADGRFIVFDGHKTLVVGRYVADGHTFTEMSESIGCSVPATFNYSFDGADLTFSYRDDPSRYPICQEIYADFDGQTYVLVK